MLEGIDSVVVKRFQDGRIANQKDILAAEVPVALIYNGVSHVVMMATPNHLDNFALGFSLSEKIIISTAEIYGIEIQLTDNGIEMHIELASRRFEKLKRKRRAMNGRTGCGLCGKEHLRSVCETPTILPLTQRINLCDLSQSWKMLESVQIIGQRTGCTHAAIWVDKHGQCLAGFEDVGRHVALDKLLGFRAKQFDQHGAVIISSRASYEMVQKSINCGVEILCAVSAPTALAVKMASESRLTLLGFCRGDKGIIYTHSKRIVL